MEPTLTVIEKTAFLKSVDMLSRVPTEALAELAARASEIHCEPDEVLYREGDPNRGAFVVIDGQLEQRKGRALVRLLRPGATGGELWLGAGESHEYTLVASQHSHVLNITREDVIDGMLDHPTIAVALVMSLASAMHRLIGRTLELENLIAKLHVQFNAAGIEPHDPRSPAEDETERSDPR